MGRTARALEAFRLRFEKTLVNVYDADTEGRIE